MVRGYEMNGPTRSEDYTGITTVHDLKCGHKIVTYKAKSSITLRNHIKRCTQKGPSKFSYAYSVDSFEDSFLVFRG